MKNEVSIEVEWAWKEKGVTFEVNGHKVRRPDHMWSLLRELDENTLRILLRAVEDQVPLADFVALGGSVLNTCYTCGEATEFETDGLVIRPKNPCSYPNGIPLTLELNVSSGVMIVANDLRPHFNFVGDYDINTDMGCVKTAKAMEAIGCAHAFVGNSCPGMYKTGENTFMISSVGYDEEAGEDIEPEGVRVAGIITDLWWYSIVDADEFERRGCEGRYNVDRVQVKPGVYLFTHFQHLDHQSDEPFTHTLIEWVRPPEPVRDCQAESVNKSIKCHEGFVVKHTTRGGEQICS